MGEQFKYIHPDGMPHGFGKTSHSLLLFGEDFFFLHSVRNLPNKGMWIILLIKKNCNEIQKPPWREAVLSCGGAARGVRCAHRPLAPVLQIEIKNALNGRFKFCLIVELRGVEPRSKRETHMLSTCLAHLQL